MPSPLHEAAYVELVALLVEVRTSAGLTQTELGEKLGKPQSYVSKVERRERRVDILEFTAWMKSTGSHPPDAYAELLGRLNLD